MREELAQIYDETEQIIKLCQLQRKILIVQQAALRLQQEHLKYENERLAKQEGTKTAPRSSPDPGIGH